MALSLDDVRRIAHLSRIALEGAEEEAVLSELNRVFGLIADLQAVDTRGVEPMSHALDVMQRLRADAVTETDQHGLYQALAPQTGKGLYLVPKVIE
jgi:aspartyl-tRNA(Asn)/glutamyl-tRNA(Gln) amidotransferase subunit C